MHIYVTVEDQVFGKTYDLRFKLRFYQTLLVKARKSYHSRLKRTDYKSDLLIYILLCIVLMCFCTLYILNSFSTVKQVLPYRFLLLHAFTNTVFKA
jgi:hypothetical protein